MSVAMAPLNEGFGTMGQWKASAEEKHIYKDYASPKKVELTRVKADLTSITAVNMASPTSTMVTRSPVMVATVPINLTLTVSLGGDSSNISASATERRRSQNRINQRAVRRRRAARRTQQDQVFDLDAAPSSSFNSPSALTRENSQQYQDQTMSEDTKDLLPFPLPSQMPQQQLDPYHSIASLPFPSSTQPALPPAQRLPLPPLSPTSNASWCRTMEAFLTTHHIANITVDETINTASGETATVSFEKSFLKNLNPADFFRLPADDHLLSLMYYNVFRALATNSRMLGLDTYAMHADDYPSPFFTPDSNPNPNPNITTTITTPPPALISITEISTSSSASNIHSQSQPHSRQQQQQQPAMNINTGPNMNTSIPPHLRPTLLQRTVPHHPCFDIFPDPMVRDHGIRNTHLLPHGMLCMSLAGRNTWFENDRSRRNGLLIWGPPEDARSWEVTEGFVACYGWLVHGAALLQESTNRWRAVRGEPELSFA